jgi:predicted alpha/beta superfamily hydrolase
MKSILPIMLLLLSALGISSSSHSQDAVSVSSSLGQQEFSIQSKNTQDTREIVVHLPKNYDPDREEGYPVIYMLDAGSTDKLTAEMASFYHWGDLMPEVIVIGLKNVGRGFDFLPHYYEPMRDGEQVPGNGGKLLAYIENELIPFANNQFNTNGDDVFAGHSWGGQFVTYALSQSPGLFDAYFITSPAFGDDGKWRKKTFDALEQTLKQDLDFPDLVYLSVGGEGYPGPLTDSVLLPDYYRLTALLRQYLPKKVKFYHEVHDSANHTSNSAISIAKALQLHFATSPEVE